MGAVCGVENFIAYLEKRYKSCLAQLKPPIALAFVVGCSEPSHLEDNFLVVIVASLLGSQGEEVLIIDHPDVGVDEDFPWSILPQVTAWCLNFTSESINNHWALPLLDISSLKIPAPNVNVFWEQNTHDVLIHCNTKT